MFSWRCIFLCSVHTKSGCYAIPFPPTIQLSAEGEAQFVKRSSRLKGAVSIITYDLCNSSSKEAAAKIAIMSKVPLKQKPNQCGLGVFDIGTECNRDLFHEMSKNSGTTFVRGPAKGPNLTYKSESVTIMATMSKGITASVKVQVKKNSK